MPDAPPFDTHRSYKRLTAAGFTERQAEEQTQMLSELVEYQLVTRDHLDARLKELEYRLTIRLGGIIVVAVGALAALVTVLAYLNQ